MLESTSEGKFEKAETVYKNISPQDKSKQNTYRAMYMSLEAGQKSQNKVLNTSKQISKMVSLPYISRQNSNSIGRNHFIMPSASNKMVQSLENTRKMVSQNSKNDLKNHNRFNSYLNKMPISI